MKGKMIVGRITLVILLVCSVWMAGAAALEAGELGDLRAFGEELPRSPDPWRSDDNTLDWEGVEGSRAAQIERYYQFPSRELPKDFPVVASDNRDFGNEVALKNVPRSANSEWRTVANGDYVQRLARDGDTLIESSLGGGAIFWDLETGIYAQYLYPQDGIGDNWVYEIVKDFNGAYWAAHLASGLSRTEGVIWQVISPPIAGITQRCQTVAAFGDYIIVGTASAILRFDQVLGSWATLYDTGSLVNWSDVLVDPSGVVWATTLTYSGFRLGNESGNVVAIWPDSTVKVFNTKPGSSPESIYFLNLAPDGRLWVSTVQYLAISQKPTPEIDGFDLYGFGGEEVGDVRWDGDGNAWVGTSGGLYFWPKKAPKPVKYAGGDKGIKHAFTLELSEDEKTVFVGTQGAGIKIFDIEQRQVVGELRTKGLKGSPTCAVTDPFGNLWLGTRDEGLNVISEDGEWLYFKDSLSSPKVRGLAVSLTAVGRCQLAVATPRGLTVADIAVPWMLQKGHESGPFVELNNITRVDVSACGLDANVASVAYDERGRLWFATRSGIGNLEGGTISCWQTAYLDGSMSVDLVGDVEVGSLTGVQIFSLQAQTFRQKKEIPAGYVRAISLSNEESWYALMSWGVYVLRGEKLMRFSRESEGWDFGLDYALDIALLGDEAYVASSSWGLDRRSADGSWEKVLEYCHFDCTWVYSDLGGGCIYAGGDSLAPCHAFSVKGCGARFSTE